MSSCGASSHSSRNYNSYRRRSSNSEVDETLFASSHPDSTSKLQRERAKNGGRSRNRDRGNNNKLAKATVISRDHLNALKARAVISSQQEKEKALEEKRALLKEKRKVAEARKERMLKLEEERKSKKVLNAEEIEDEIAVNATLRRANDLAIEQIDQVKTMRRKMIYAQCAKIREQQIEEKKIISEKKKAFEERQDTLMEIDRLKMLKKTEREERMRATNRKKDAQLIRKQIEARATQKILADELLEQEKQQMKETIKAQEVEALQKRKEKQLQGKKLLVEVLAANSQAIEQKSRRIQEEKEEDERILKWQEEKRLQEEELEAEKIRIQKQKDKEFYEMAAKMKKSQDNRSEQDALRAKRHQQEEERKQRERDRKQREKEKAQLKELKEARTIQSRRKIENLKILALQDKETCEKINRENAEIQARHDQIEIEKIKMNSRHQKELKQQMQRRERAKKQLVEERRKQGEDIRIENARYLKKIQKKKEAILEQMKHGGIPEKYCAELSRFPVNLS